MSLVFCVRFELAACVAMEGRPAKLARLQTLRDALPFISQSALAAILKISQREQLPSGTRKDIRHARDTVALQATPYGPISQVINLSPAGGADFHAEIQHPFAMLYYCCSTSSALSGLVKRCVQKQQPTLANPWRIIFYTDEITPGNPMGYKNLRKLWAIYWSILEFGPEVLSDEDTGQAYRVTSLLLQLVDSASIHQSSIMSSLLYTYIYVYVSLHSSVLQHRIVISNLPRKRGSRWSFTPLAD